MFSAFHELSPPAQYARTNDKCQAPHNHCESPAKFLTQHHAQQGGEGSRQEQAAREDLQHMVVVLQDKKQPCGKGGAVYLERAAVRKHQCDAA